MFRFPFAGSYVTTWGSVMKRPPSPGQQVRTGRESRSGSPVISWEGAFRTMRTGVWRNRAAVFLWATSVESFGGKASSMNRTSCSPSSPG